MRNSFLVMLFSMCAGCATPARMPLMFVQSHTVGISIGGSAADQGAEFTLGYKDRNFAIVPVAVEQAGGGSSQLTAKATADYTDAMSVFGQFEVKTDRQSRDVGLGKFFATGQAAKKLADGFYHRLKQTPEGAPGSGDAGDTQDDAPAPSDGGAPPDGPQP